MERKEMRRRGKGLLALVLAMTMLFGMSMTAFAKEYTLRWYDPDLDKLPVGTILRTGDEIQNVGDANNVDTGGLIVYLNNQPQSNTNIEDERGRLIGEKYSINSGTYKVESHGFDPSYCWREIRLVSCEELPLPSTDSNQSGTGSSHEHYYQWEETLEATATSDGLLENICECGVVNGRVVVPGAMACFKEFCEKIQNAPEGSTVEWNPLHDRCYTRRMMEELEKRPDVTLNTVYTEPDGSIKSFTIPAGGAPADSELFYGFTYLGNLYGWN